MTPSIHLPTALFIAFSGLTISNSQAIILSDRTNQDTLPISSAPFPIDHVGALQNGGNATAIYLGSGYAIGSSHAFGAKNDIIIDGTFYNWDPSINDGVGSYPLMYNGYEMDIRIFKLEGDIHLPGTTLASSSPSIGETVYMAGIGATGTLNDAGTIDQEDDSFDWPASRIYDSSVGSFVPTWGTNIVSSNSDGIAGPLFSTTFDSPDSPDAIPLEASAANGDSGGAAFVQRNGSWELSGMVTHTDGKSTNATRYGYQTTFLDLSQFDEQFDAILSEGEAVPEPSSAFLLILSIIPLLRRRR